MACHAFEESHGPCRPAAAAPTGSDRYAYVEQFSPIPSERDAAQLHGPREGYKVTMATSEGSRQTRITSCVQRGFADGTYQGAMWPPGNPHRAQHIFEARGVPKGV